MPAPEKEKTNGRVGVRMFSLSRSLLLLSRSLKLWAADAKSGLPGVLKIRGVYFFFQLTIHDDNHYAVIHFELENIDAARALFHEKQFRFFDSLSLF